jgi:hypothetical protein
LSDHRFTELISGELVDGQKLVTGTQRRNGSGASASVEF